MARILNQMLALAIISSIATILPITTAEASRYKAKCRGPYQLVQGNWISSPICEERVLRRVARSYGTRVSSRYSIKISICFAYGHDIRLSGICGAYRPRGR